MSEAKITALKATLADNEVYCATLSSRCESLQALLKEVRGAWPMHGVFNGSPEAKKWANKVDALLAPKPSQSDQLS